MVQRTTVMAMVNMESLVQHRQLDRVASMEGDNSRPTNFRGSRSNCSNNRNNLSSSSSRRDQQRSNESRSALLLCRKSNSVSKRSAQQANNYKLKKQLIALLNDLCHLQIILNRLAKNMDAKSVHITTNCTTITRIRISTLSFNSLRATRKTLYMYTIPPSTTHKRLLCANLTGLQQKLNEPYSTLK